MDDLGENGIEHNYHLNQLNQLNNQSEQQQQQIDKIDMQDDLQELHSNCQVIDKEPPTTATSVNYGNNEPITLDEDESDEEETPDDIITDYDETLG